MAYLITVDWGTSYLRAYLCQDNGKEQLDLIDMKLGYGVTKCQTSFEEELFRHISTWLNDYGDMPIYMAGQIGSSIGWQETQYLSCPVSPKDIAEHCLHFQARNHTLSIVPGVSCLSQNNNFDVMRSEELQVLGWVASNPEHEQGKYLLCLPGTHTKWVLVSEGKIILFKTAMTGELFDLLSYNSVLIAAPDQKFEPSSFKQGLDYTLESETGSFTHGVFSVRGNQLLGDMSPQQASSYLSGLLIGSDVRAAIMAKEWDISAFDFVTIIGADHLSECFATALESKNIRCKKLDIQKATLYGFSELFRLKKNS